MSKSMQKNSPHKAIIDISSEALATEWNTRRAPHMERYVAIEPVVVEGEPDARNVFLQIGNQRFCIGPFACETLEEAEWMRDMLCVALDKLVRDHSVREAS